MNEITPDSIDADPSRSQTVDVDGARIQVARLGENTSYVQDFPPGRWFIVSAGNHTYGFIDAQGETVHRYRPTGVGPGIKYSAFHAAIRVLTAH